MKSILETSNLIKFINLNSVVGSPAEQSGFFLHDKKGVITISDNNTRLLLTCPHCEQEYIIVGIDVDKIQGCLCPTCKGFCELTALSETELIKWLTRYLKTGVS